jgi:hypothetical protein
MAKLTSITKTTQTKIHTQTRHTETNTHTAHTLKNKAHKKNTARICGWSVKTSGASTSCCAGCPFIKKEKKIKSGKSRRRLLCLRRMPPPKKKRRGFEINKYKKMGEVKYINKKIQAH